MQEGADPGLPPPSQDPVQQATVRRAQEAALVPL